MCVCKCVCEWGVRKWVGWVGGRVGGWVGVGGHPVGVGWGVCVGGGRSFVERSFFFSFTFSVSSCELPMGASRVCEP